MYTSRQYFVIKIYKNINHRCFNFLFELLKGMSLIGSYLDLITLEKIVLIKKIYRARKDRLRYEETEHLSLANSIHLRA